MVLSHLGQKDAMEDALRVVSAYHHLDEQLAFVIRLRYLSLDDKVSDELDGLFSLMNSSIMPAVFREYFSWARAALQDLGEYISGTYLR